MIKEIYIIISDLVIQILAEKIGQIYLKKLAKENVA